MKKTIETRELFVLDGLDGSIPGTYHKTSNDSSGIQSNLAQRNRVGVVFLNSLSSTRAANGDGAVYWADSFAQRGYPSFRLDLPGFGDSNEDPPPELHDFINQGKYAFVASAKIRELVARFNLSGVIIFGHCAGAVSAIYTAAVSGECRGLVLMGPYFHLPSPMRPKIRQQLSRWALKSHLGGHFSNIYDRLKKVRLTLRQNVLPQNANFPLLRCWKEVSSTGLPILILMGPARKASGTEPRPGEFDYLKHILGLAGRRGRVVVKSADGANHSFSNYLARTAVQQHTEQWLDAYFPLAECRDSDADAVCAESDNGNMTIEIASSVR